MTLLFSSKSRLELREIWLYNAKRYGVYHADGYDAFLLRGIAELTGAYGNGTEIEGYPSLFRVTLRRGRGDGHVIVYEFDESKEIVHVLHVYHTKQDVEGRLRRER